MLKFSCSFKNLTTDLFKPIEFFTDISCASGVSDKLVKLACPMCSLVCSSYCLLQEHVELHLQEQHHVYGRCHFAPSSLRTVIRQDCRLSIIK